MAKTNEKLKQLSRIYVYLLCYVELISGVFAVHAEKW